MIINDDYDDYDDAEEEDDGDDNDNDIPDGVAADNDDHNVDAHSGDQNLALSDQFLKEKIEIGDWRFTLNSVNVYS